MDQIDQIDLTLPFQQYATPIKDQDIRISDAVMVRYGNARVERVVAVTATMIAVYSETFPDNMERYHRHLLEVCGFFVQKRKWFGLGPKVWTFVPRAYRQ